MRGAFGDEVDEQKLLSTYGFDCGLPVDTATAAIIASGMGAGHHAAD